MKVTVHAEGSAAEIAKQLKEHAAVYAGGATAPATEAAAAPAGKGKKGKKAAQEEEEEFDLDDQDESDETEEEESEEDESDETEEEESEEDESDETEEEDETEEASLQDVIAAFAKYAKKNSREKAAQVLKKLGVKNVKQLKTAEQRAKALSLLKK